jgi:hypothetical protein
MPRGSCKNRSLGELVASIISVTRICELGTTLAVTNNRSTLRRSAIWDRKDQNELQDWGFETGRGKQVVTWVVREMFLGQTLKWDSIVSGGGHASVASYCQLLLSSPILVTLMMVATRSSETSVLTGVTRRNIPEDGILHSHRRENLKSYITLTGWPP